MLTSGMKRCALVGVFLLFPAASATAYDGASIAVTGRVPTVCQVSISAPPAHAIQTGANDLGTMRELCNSLAGYKITLNHPAGLVDAWVDVGGVRVPLSPTQTHTVIVDNRTPAYRERQLRLVLNQAPAVDMDFSLEAEPKGAVF
ncbi:hypothetical protein EDF57_11186 [Novosphingobium sp. PhB55]|uniref:hypothetical protein n=1 Tax=Novosphingobium sp. PhB55 TaxID=2485106 RepID=UPI001065778F|nr:hypothetical protein [Novosphingobium sp. PhB55]TDW59957.1 hypothetical protein EDF57_11186 [Novosphingobium sp. PhB55]